jgi:CubicO group peptidase (beta-lactamase class C family)
VRGKILTRVTGQPVAKLMRDRVLRRVHLRTPPSPHGGASRRQFCTLSNEGAARDDERASPGHGRRRLHRPRTGAVA